MVFKHLSLPPLPILEERVISGKRHYVTEDGNLLPSVTTILSYYPKPELEAWKQRVGKEQADAIRDIASARGQMLHKMIENYLNNRPSLTNIKEPIPSRVPAANSALDMFLVMKPELDKIDNISYQEVILHSKKIGLAGKCDAIAEYDGVKSIVDFKQSKRKRTEEMVHTYFLQICLYSLLYQDMTGIAINQGVILMAIENDSPQIWIFDVRKYVSSAYQSFQHYKKCVDNLLIK